MSSSSSQAKHSPGELAGGEPPQLPLVVWRNVFVVIDDGTVSLADIEIISQRVLALGLRHPNGVGGLTLIPVHGRPPSEAHRQAIKRAYQLVARHLKAMCWIVEGQGFRAATIRAALAGLRMLLQPPFPTRVGAGIEDALPWLCTQLNENSPANISEGLREIRSAVTAVQRSRESLRPLT